MESHNTLLTWYPVTEEPEEKWRILVFSPAYPKGHEMRIRIIEGQFLRICKEATYWAYPKEPEYDRTPWCSGCGAMTKGKCNCGPIADND